MRRRARSTELGSSSWRGTSPRRTGANDPERASRARTERDFLVSELRAAVGLGGRPRRGQDPAERARKAVTWRVRELIGQIAAAHPALGHHLRRAVRTGSVCAYDPDQPTHWQLEPSSDRRAPDYLTSLGDSWRLRGVGVTSPCRAHPRGGQGVGMERARHLSGRMRRGLALVPAMLCMALPATQVQAEETHPAGFTAIDHPGAGTAIGQGTFPQGTNNRTVVGYYVDSGGLVFGWRYEEGRFTDINDPSADSSRRPAAAPRRSPCQTTAERWWATTRTRRGCSTASPSAGASTPRWTCPSPGPREPYAQGVNDAGLVSGGYLDSSGGFHGFTLWHGHYTAVNYPGPTSTGTALVSMNDRGTIAAVWDQGPTITHGFLYRSGKVVAHIDYPNAAGGTFPFCVNDHMTAAGQYTDSGGTTHGFTWHSGHYTTVDDPAGTTSGLCIADNGTIMGIYTDSNGVAHGFITRADDD